MIALLEVISKPQPLAHRIVNGLATGAGILGILGAIEVIRSWMIGVNMELKIAFTIAMFIISGSLFFIAHKYLRK